LEDTFLVRTLSIATDSERRRMVNPRKAYPIDPGLIPLFDRSGRSDLGHALETAVLLELDRRQADISYVHTPAGLEVDFLARHPSGVEQLIQVCASLDDPMTRERKIRALHSVAPHQPATTLNLIALDVPAAVEIPPNITLHHAADWMLAGDP
jgi:predicted AAA+ superfamily ATPase